MEGSFEVLTIDEIAFINRRMIQSSGGDFTPIDNNFQYKPTLENALASANETYWGEEVYPTLAAKIAVISWRIIAGHAFRDGNKRTGLETCRQLCEMNGYLFRIDQEAKEMALAVGGERERKVLLEEFTEWLAARIVPVDSSRVPS